MTQIHAYKKEANSLKMQLSTKDDENLARLENEAAFLKNSLHTSEREQEGLQKVAKEQIKALSSVFNEDEATAKIAGMKTELAQLTEREKAIKTQLTNGQAEHKAVHAQMIDLEERCRSLQKRSKSGAPPPQQVEETKVHEEELVKWKKNADILEKTIKKDEKMMKQKMSLLESALSEVTTDHQGYSDKATTREQDIKLKELKLKELKNKEKQLQQRNAELEAKAKALKEVELMAHMKKSPRVEVPEEQPVDLVQEVLTDALDGMKFEQ